MCRKRSSSYKRIFITVILILLTISGPVLSQDHYLYNWMKNKIVHINHTYIDNGPISADDKVTKTQASNRAKWILKYAKELNYIAPEFHYKRVAKDFFAIMEYESHFINYYDMDNGQSFGTTALTWFTGQGIADYFGDNLNLYSNGSYSQADRNYMKANVELQIKYGMYYYYERLKSNLNKVNKNLVDYKSNVRRAAITEYNTGPGIDPNKERWRNYTFAVEGRISYHSSIMK